MAEVHLECRSNGFYEIVVNGEPTGQGSTDYNVAQDMLIDYED